MSQDYGVLCFTKPGTVVELMDIVFIMLLFGFFADGVDCCVLFARGDHPGDYTFGPLK